MALVSKCLPPCVLQPSKYKLIEPTLVDDLVKHYPGEFDLITEFVLPSGVKRNCAVR